MSSQDFAAAVAVELPRLRRAAWRIAPAGVDPDDLVQDVLERAWRSRGSFRADALLSTWLHRILLNRARDLARKIRPGGAMPEEGALEALTVDDPAGVIGRSEDRDRLRQALSLLSVDDRMVLVLHDGEEWTAGQISTLTGWSVASVYKRLQRARLRLVQALSESTGFIQRQSRECRDARGMLGPYFDGALEQQAVQVVDSHLLHCNHCPPLAQAMLGLRAALARAEDAPEISARLSGSLALLRQEASSLRDRDGP
ncbi:sigma-70 family RNA polymerase sigma factor [Pseudarthrobacter oxydans]|uniref:sigma-70 family RNA polymerase sigma factor n=1 Tax=Pseudarthrobacter oxydans TaxID=1671 RepID=UPI00381285C8